MIEEFKELWWKPPPNWSQRWCHTGEHFYHKRDQQPGCACCRQCFKNWKPHEQADAIRRYGDWKP